MTPRHVLIVAPFLPWPADFGGAQRVYHLVAELATSARVTLVAPASEAEFDAAWKLSEIFDVTLVPARRTVRQTAGVSKRVSQIRALANGQASVTSSFPVEGVRQAIERQLRIKQVDLIQVEFPQMMLALPEQRPPVVLDAHNIEYELLRRVADTTSHGANELFNRLEWRRMRRLEQRAWREADLTIATSRRDASMIAKITGKTVPVIPNGVDIKQLSDQPRDCRSHEVVFVAAMRHQPNADGAVWLAREVLPLVRQQLPGARLRLVGADPPAAVQALRGPSIDVTGRVDDVRPELARAGAVAVPLFAGGGTRLKILEAMAAGVPVVSTSIGAEGLSVAHDQHILIADDAQTFAASLVRLLTDLELAQRLRGEGRDLAQREYAWSHIAKELRRAHEALNQRSGADDGS